MALLTFFLALYCIGAPVKLFAKINATPIAVTDERLAQPTDLPVIIRVLDNDIDDDGDLNPASVRILDPTDLVTERLEVVSAGEGVWRVDTDAGSITFTPCTESGVPDPSCTDLFMAYPMPVEYVVQDSNGDRSNPAIVLITFDLDGGVDSLPVTLSYVTSTRHDAVVRFSWQTATETANAGFNLLAESPAGLVYLNDALIPSLLIDSVEPTEYNIELVTQAKRFFIEEIGIDGNSSRKGPFDVGLSYGALIVSDRPDLGARDVRVYLPFAVR